jgi:hypothetical protein
MMAKHPGGDSNRVPSKYNSQALIEAILLGRVGGKISGNKKEVTSLDKSSVMRNFKSYSLCPTLLS